MSKKQDAAARIAAREYAVDMWSTDNEVGQSKAYMPRLERAIRRAITAAVRKERERCLDAVGTEAVAARAEKRFVSGFRIIEAIKKGKA